MKDSVCIAQIASPSHLSEEHTFLQKGVRMSDKTSHARSVQLRQSLPVKTHLRLVTPARTILPPAPPKEMVEIMGFDDLVMFFALQKDVNETLKIALAMFAG
jgi:hypothetical protein